MRIPHLPQYCAHTLRPFVPLTDCALCEIQIPACEIWWNSRHHHDGDSDSGRVEKAAPRATGTPRGLYADDALSLLCAWASAWRA
jgi:hypothetical protein